MENYTRLALLRFLLSARNLPFRFREDLFIALNGTSPVDRQIMTFCDTIFPGSLAQAAGVPVENRREFLDEVITGAIPDILLPFEPEDVKSPAEILEILSSRISVGYSMSLIAKLQEFAMNNVYGKTMEGDKQFRQGLDEIIELCRSAISYIDKKSASMSTPDLIVGGEDVEASRISMTEMSDSLSSNSMINDLVFRTGSIAVNRTLSANDDDDGSIFEAGGTYVISGFPGQKKSILVGNILYSLPIYSDFSRFRKKNPGKIPAIVHLELENRKKQTWGRFSKILSDSKNPEKWKADQVRYLGSATECAVIVKHFLSGDITPEDAIRFFDSVSDPYVPVALSIDYLGELEGSTGRGDKDPKYAQQVAALRQLAVDFARVRDVVNLNIFQYTKDTIQNVMKIPFVLGNIDKIMDMINIGNLSGGSELSKIPDKIITCIPLFANMESRETGELPFPEFLGMKVLRNRDSATRWTGRNMVGTFENGVKLQYDYKRPAQSLAERDEIEAAKGRTSNTNNKNGGAK